MAKLHGGVVAAEPRSGNVSQSLTGGGWIKPMAYVDYQVYPNSSSVLRCFNSTRLKYGLTPGPTSIEEMEEQVDNQVAAPAETRTPNLHRAKIAHRE